MKSKIFHTGRYKAIETAIKDLVNGTPDFLTARSANSPRAVGDAIQDLLSENFQKVLGDACTEYSAQFARRAMADLAFEDPEGLYYVVDVKTHRRTTKFNMPNLTSVERLARFYEEPKNCFVILMIAYDVVGTKLEVESVRFVPIEFLSWECLTIGALGWGQIQIANSNVIQVNEGFSRRRWMLELCDTLLEFYPREISKIGDRIEHFKKVRERWEKVEEEK